MLAYSQKLKLPIDIIVQPQARAGDVPLAMGFERAAASWCCRCAAIRMPKQCSRTCPTPTAAC